MASRCRKERLRGGHAFAKPMRQANRSAVAYLAKPKAIRPCPRQSEMTGAKREPNLA